MHRNVLTNMRCTISRRVCYNQLSKCSSFSFLKLQFSFPFFLFLLFLLIFSSYVFLLLHSCRYLYKTDIYSRSKSNDKVAFVFFIQNMNVIFCNFFLLKFFHANPALPTLQSANLTCILFVNNFVLLNETIDGAMGQKL